MASALPPKPVMPSFLKQEESAVKKPARPPTLLLAEGCDNFDAEISLTSKSNTKSSRRKKGPRGVTGKEQTGTIKGGISDKSARPRTAIPPSGDAKRSSKPNQGTLRGASGVPGDMGSLRGNKAMENAAMGTLRGKSGIPGGGDNSLRGRSGVPGDVNNRGRSGVPGDMNSLRGKSGIPGDSGTLRGKSGVPSSMGTLRGKSGVPSSMATLRGKSGIPTDPRGSLILKQNSNVNNQQGTISGTGSRRKPIERKKTMNVPSTSSASSSEISMTDSSLLLDPSQFGLDDTGSLRHSSIISENSFSGQSFDGSLLPGFANLDNDPLISGFDPNANFLPGFDPSANFLPGFDPNATFDPNANFLPGFDPNANFLPGFDPSASGGLPGFDPNAGGGLPGFDAGLGGLPGFDPSGGLPIFDPSVGGFDPSAVVNDYDDDNDDDIGFVPGYEPNSGGLPLEPNIAEPRESSTFPKFETVPSSSKLPKFDSFANDDDGPVFGTPGEKKMDFGSDEEEEFAPMGSTGVKKFPAFNPSKPLDDTDDFIPSVPERKLDFGESDDEDDIFTAGGANKSQYDPNQNTINNNLKPGLPLPPSGLTSLKQQPTFTDFAPAERRIDFGDEDFDPIMPAQPRASNKFPTFNPNTSFAPPPKELFAAATKRESTREIEETDFDVIEFQSQANKNAESDDSDSENKNNFNTRQKPMAPNQLKMPASYMDPNQQFDATSLFAVAPVGMNMNMNASLSISDSGPLDNSSIYELSSDTGTSQNIPGVVRRDDTATNAKVAISTIRENAVDAGKVIAKHATVVAEQVGIIESSKIRSWIKKTFEELKQNDPTLITVTLSSCRLTRTKLKELCACLSSNTVVRKIDLSNKGINDPETSMSSFCKGLHDNPYVTHIDVSGNGCGLSSAVSIERLLKRNLNITRFDIQERIFHTYDRAELARALQSIQWLLNSNYAYQAFKYGKSTSLVLSGRNYKQLVGRLLEGAERVQYFDISYNELEEFPLIIDKLTQVQQFIANHNHLISIVGTAIANFDRLMKLDLSFNQLTMLPDELCELVNVQELQCSHNQITELPEMFRLMQSLKRVDFSHNQITKLPTELSNLTHLEIFLVNDNLLVSLPDSLFFIASLRILNLANNRLLSLPEETPNLQNLEELDLSFNSISQIPEYFGTFGQIRRMNLANNKLSLLPDEFTRMKNTEYLNIANNTVTALPEHFGNLWRMVEFYAQNNKLTTLPKTLQLLRYLKVLDLSNNKLKALDHFLCTLVSLNTLRLFKNEPLKGMSQEILEKAEKYDKSEKEEKRKEGEQMVLDFVKQLPKVPISTSRMKLMIVGKKGSGKTSLFEALKMKSLKQRQKRNNAQDPEPTAGIHVENLKFKDITFSTWDFSGDEQYYTTHQLFLSERVIYLLVCNMMDPESEDSRIEQWLELITRKIDDQVPIVVVGTHLDDKACNGKHRKAFWNRVKANIGSRFPNILGYEAISAKFNKKTDALLEKVLKIAEKRSYIPQQVMRGYQYLEERIHLLNGLMKTPMTSLKRFSEEVMACGVAPDGVKEAMKFMNDAGVLVYFGDTCPTLVFLEPQWIVELISSFNQIKKFAKKGMVNRSEFQNIWNPSKYPEKYHEYILMLLERFEMLMRLKEQGRIFFPELLEEEPTPSVATLHMMWAPGYEMEEPEFRRSLYYQFIPNTLFPRVIGKVVHTLGWEIQNYWKNGSILTNNKGSSSFFKLDAQEKQLHITVRGEKAGADLMSILDTIEQLNESFHLTDVESFVPCTHCLLLEEDAKPFMFPISEFRAAMADSKEYVLCGGEVAVKLRALLPNGAL